jgi:site-specific recombinase XerD
VPSLKYYLNPNDENLRVKLRYTFNRDSRTDFFSGVSLSSASNFDKDNELNPIKRKEPDYEFKNSQLRHLKRTVEDIIQSLRLNDKTPTALLVKDKFKLAKVTQHLNTDFEHKINAYFILPKIDEYVAFLRGRVRVGDNLRDSSFEKVERIMKKWTKFFEAKKEKDIQFEDLRYRNTLFREFAEWCLNKENQFANSSINKYSSTFRSFLKWSMKMNYHNIDLVRFDAPNLKEVTNRTVLALTAKQLNTIFSFDEFNYLKKDGKINKKAEDYKKPNERYFLVEDKFVHKDYDKGGNLIETPFCKKYTSLEVYKDFFCFLCSTSLAYIDAANLKITDYDFKKDCFELIRIKTSAPTTIPMNEMSRAIWMKYSKDKNFKRSDGRKVDSHYLFPRFKGKAFFTNQSCNEGIKRIGIILKDHLSNMVNISIRSGGGIKEGTETEVPLYKVLHTHMGRKTFINFALSQKISPIDIKKITGHSDEKMFKYYVNSLRDDVKEEFQNMGAFIGDREFIGPKGSKKKNDSIEKATEILLSKRKNGVISESDFIKELGKLLDKNEKKSIAKKS